MNKDNKYWDSTATESVSLCADGKYRWRYDLNLFKEPDLFWLVWKIMFYMFSAIFLFVIVSDMVHWGFDTEKTAVNLKVYMYVVIAITAITALGYLIYAAIMGGKYCVVFEMDDQGINHRQTENQAKKAKKLAGVTAAVGAASGSLSTMGAGLGAARTEMYSEFARVKKVKPYPRKKLIKVNEILNHNRIYVRPEDFDFVHNYIVSHCENLK